MKKIAKLGFLLIILFLVIITALNVMSLITRNSLKFKKESEHFVFYCSAQDSYLLSSISVSLENEYKRISTDLRTELPKKVVIRIFPDRGSFRRSFGNPLPWPKQVEGESGKEGITVLSPKYSKADPVNILSHELTHLIKNEINPSIEGGWLSEGLASYEGKEFPAAMIYSQVSDCIKQGNIPTFHDINHYTYQQFLNNGYAFSYTIVECIVNEYGYDMLNELLKAPKDYEGIFNLTEDEFYNKWVDYIKQNY